MDLNKPIDPNDFGDIAPFTDEEAVEAFQYLSRHPNLPFISKFMFPDQPETLLHDVLLKLHSVDEFQAAIMSKAVEFILSTTARNFGYDGIEHIKALGEKKFLAMSNHRDIILDPAITPLVLYRNDIPATEIAVGDNLLSSKTIEYLIRCNRMIRVIRGVSARELYLSSMRLSNYIRTSIITGKSSVWIAQRQGRTKDGYDTTEQGLLKMFDMSGTKGFVENFKELNIVPLSISYEYEPCDVLKAREKLISREEKYVKKENEDLMSIMTGLKMYKGDIHLHIGEPLTEEEIVSASFCDKNDRYQFIRHAVDRRIIAGYRPWKTNYIAYDLVEQTDRYADHYTPEDKEAFLAYTAKQLGSVEPELDREALRDIFLRIYSNPVKAKEDLSHMEE